MSKEENLISNQLLKLKNFFKEIPENIEEYDQILYLVKSHSIDLVTFIFF